MQVPAIRRGCGGREGMYFAVSHEVSCSRLCELSGCVDAPHPRSMQQCWGAAAPALDTEVGAGCAETLTRACRRYGCILAAA